MAAQAVAVAVESMASMPNRLAELAVMAILIRRGLM